MLKKSIKDLFFYLTSVSFILFALLGSIHFWSFNESFYRSEHDSLRLYGRSIAEHIGIDDDQLAELTSFTLAYLNDPKASLDLRMPVNGVEREIFTDDEKLHMIDVRALNLLANKLLIVSGIVFVLCILYLFLHRELFDRFRLINKRLFIVIGIFFALLAIWIMIDFDSFWNSFHHVFFAGNDLWILDLRKDILIMIVPPEFFFHLVTRIFVSFAGLLLVYLLSIHFISLRRSSI